MTRRSLICLLLLTSMFSWLTPSVSAAFEFGSPAFRGTWIRADRPVSELRVSRTWLWGPEPHREALLEPYEESPGGQRVVQYFDKSRMELADPGATGELWSVTNGLLAKELVTGELQLGDGSFETGEPAQINVAGDLDDPTGPTYASFRPVLGQSPLTLGSAVTQTIDRSGQIGNDQTLARYGVRSAHLVPETGHTVASVFWDFMHAEGLVYEPGAGYRTARLVESPVYATGYPLSEPFWTTVRLADQPRTVLVQLFERRVMTFTPGNPAGWEVETGNVGQHYFSWRYADREPVQAPAPENSSKVIVLDAGHDASTGGAQGVEYRHTLRTALLTKVGLEAAGYTVWLTRTDNETLLSNDPSLLPSNAARVDPGYNEGYSHTSRALLFEPDLYISIHYNAAGSTAAAGMTIYFCDYAGPQNELIAGILAEELRAGLVSVGYTPPYAVASEDGTIGKTYGHLATLGNVYSAPFVFEGNRLMGVPAALTEALFVTNPTERSVIESDAAQRALAAAYVRAVDRYFGR